MARVDIRALEQPDLEAACHVLGLAFADNPNTLVLARGDPVRARQIMRVAARVGKLGRSSGSTWVAESEGQLVGVLHAAEWPRCQATVAEKLLSAPRMIGVMGIGMPRALRLMNCWERHDPRQAHWHVGPIGVHPDHQGQGLGGRLLTSFLALVDARHSAAYLETDVDRNVRLYERFGFRVIDEATVSGVLNRFMWREPTTSGPAQAGHGTHH